MLVSGYILPSNRSYETYSTHISLKVKRKENIGFCALCDIETDLIHLWLLALYTHCIC